jgi:hypothetical protein
MLSPIPIVLRRHKYAALLVVLLALLATQSFDAQAGATGLVSDALRTVLGVSLLLVVFERPNERAGMTAILFVALTTAWGTTLPPRSSITRWRSADTH